MSVTSLESIYPCLVRRGLEACVECVAADLLFILDKVCESCRTVEHKVYILIQAKILICFISAENIHGGLAFELPQ